MSELTELIGHGEGLHLDFKFRIDDQRKIARTLVAFANTDGGTLLIGVKDNGKLSGVDPVEEYYMIEGAAENYCLPNVKFDRKVWQEDKYLILQIDVPFSSRRHKAMNEEGKYITYYRIEDNTVAGNKILNKVWFYKVHGLQRPGKFNESTTALLRSFQDNQSLSLSQLYRSVAIRKSEIDDILPALIHWEIVGYTMKDDRIYYYIRD